jgi:hypothetical protein
LSNEGSGSSVQLLRFPSRTEDGSLNKVVATTFLSGIIHALAPDMPFAAI